MTTPMRHPVDGRVHFSELKSHARSPAHVKLACQKAREMTRPMMVGGLGDSMVFAQGRGHATYTGPTRRGKEWEKWREEHPGMLLPIQSEVDDARGAADAVLADPVAASILDGCNFQQVLQWEAFGLECAAGIAGERGGFDAINLRPRSRPPYIADLKMTSCSEPEELSRHVLRMQWHAQGAWYLHGAREHGMDVSEFLIIAVESEPPHNVTVMRIPMEVIGMGEKLLTIWTDQHRRCEDAGVWPGYVGSVVDLIVPEWLQEHTTLEGLED